MSVPRAIRAQYSDFTYRGIESFRFMDRAIFSARRQEAQKLVRIVMIYRGVLLFGAPGVGKSSLINAGFIPAIIDEGFAPERVRLQPRAEQELIIERIPTEAEGEPPFLPSLFAAEDDARARIVVSTERFKAIVAEARQESAPLFIFDQFEEFVTLFEEAPRPVEVANAKRAQDAVLDLLADLLRDHSLRVKLLFSFREDYFVKLARLFSLAPDLTDHHYRLRPPARSVVPEIIAGPFATPELKRHFGKELPREVVAGLLDEVAGDDAK